MSETKTPGQIGYEAYCVSTGGKSLISGAPLPQWSETKPEIRAAWEAAAVAVIERLATALSFSEPRTNDSVSFSSLRDANVKRCEEVFHKINGWSPADWATAMAWECGEAYNEVKKLRRLDGADGEFDSPEMRRGLAYKIGSELADVVIYADLLAARLGLDLEEYVAMKFNDVSRARGSTHFLHYKGCKV